MAKALVDTRIKLHGKEKIVKILRGQVGQCVQRVDVGEEKDQLDCCQLGARFRNRLVYLSMI